MHAAVIGCGFSGLSCAMRLLEAGFGATVVAREEPRDTVSAVAGGLWLPYEVGPLDRVGAWGAATYRELEARGAQLVDALLVGAAPPAWADALPAGRVQVVPEGVLLRAPLVVRPRPDARPRAIVREEELAYVLPRPDVCVLGGSAERGEAAAEGSPSRGAAPTRWPRWRARSPRRRRGRPRAGSSP